MNHFHVCKKFRSIFLTALAVVVMVCSVPSFSINSQAAEAAAGYLASQAILEYLGLSSYLMSKGYKAPHLQGSINNILDPVVEYDARFKAAKEITDAYIDLVKVSSAVRAEELSRALSRASTSGKLVISSDLDDFLTQYMESITVDQSMVVGYTTEDFYPISAGETFSFSYTYVDKNNISSVHSTSFNIDINYDCLPIVNYIFDSYGMLQNLRFYFIPLEYKGSSDINASNIGNLTVTGDDVSDARFNRVYLNDTLGYIGQLDFNFQYNSYLYNFNNFNAPDFLTVSSTLAAIATSVLVSVCTYLRNYGFYSDRKEYVSEQAYDTSNIDVLSVQSEIDQSTGEVAPGTTIYLPDTSALTDVLKDFSDNVISWITAIKSIGLSSVASDSTVAQKEAALDRVATPDSTYQWISETTWGAETISQTITEEIADTESIEQDYADELSEEYESNDPDNDDNEKKKGKSGLALLLAAALLYFSQVGDPGFDPSDPDAGGLIGDPEDPTTTPWLVDTLTALPIVSGIVSSIFSSAGGGNGYGLIFNVGVSFVLFSVLIGAGHFFGSLGNSAEIKAAKADKETVRQTHRNNLEISQRRLDRERARSK